MEKGDSSKDISSRSLVVNGNEKCKRIENICRFACHIAQACLDIEVRRKIARKGYTINDETCILSLPNEVVTDVHKALRAYKVYLEEKKPSRFSNRWEKLHFLPQTQEAEENGIVCLRGLNRDPRDCDGFDCPLEIYGTCVDMLVGKAEKREKKSLGISDTTKRRVRDA